MIDSLSISSSTEEFNSTYIKESISIQCCLCTNFKKLISIEISGESPVGLICWCEILESTNAFFLTCRILYSHECMLNCCVHSKMFEDTVL